MQALKLCLRWIDRLSEISGLAVSVLIPAMMLVITYEVVLRYFFRSPTVWAFDTAIFMFGYIGLIAGAYALKHGAHVNVDVFYVRLSPRGQAVIDSITLPLVLFFLILVLIQGGEAALDGIARGIRRPTEWGPPLGHFMLMIPIGAGLLILQAAANWIRALYFATTGRELEL